MDRTLFAKLGQFSCRGRLTEEEEEYKYREEKKVMIVIHAFAVFTF